MTVVQFLEKIIDFSTCEKWYSLQKKDPSYFFRFCH